VLILPLLSDKTKFFSSWVESFLYLIPFSDPASKGISGHPDHYESAAMISNSFLVALRQCIALQLTHRRPETKG
jgi:hypothetical protein